MSRLPLIAASISGVSPAWLMALTSVPGLLSSASTALPDSSRIATCSAVLRCASRTLGSVPASSSFMTVAAWSFRAATWSSGGAAASDAAATGARASRPCAHTGASSPAASVKPPTAANALNALNAASFAGTDHRPPRGPLDRPAISGRLR